MPHPLSLHHLSALDLTAPELIRAAGAAGFDHVCLFTMGWPTADFNFPVVTPGVLLRETQAALADTGISVFNIDAPFLSPEVDVDSFRAGLELGASLGATQATVVVGDPDLSRAADNFGKLCELAIPMGVYPNIEFMMLCTVRSIEAAVAMATAAGQPVRSIAVDALHLFRTGGSPADVAALDPKMIGNVQFNDGPRDMPKDRQVWEAMQGRQWPGQGAFPLRDLIAALPAGCTISVECPNDEMRARHPDPIQWAKALHAATAGVVGAAAR